MNDRIKCESVLPVETFNLDGKRMGICIKCGYTGALRPTRTLLYQHHRDDKIAPIAELTDYVAAYMEDRVWGLVDWCLECGALVKDKDAHDDFHLSVIHDLNHLRIKVAELEAAVAERVAQP